jgi:actin-related protein
MSTNRKQSLYNSYPKQKLKQRKNNRNNFLNFPCAFTPHFDFICPCSYSSGRTKGTTINFGTGVNNAVPTHDGYAFSHTTMKIKTAGSHTTDHLPKQPAEPGMNFSKKTDFEIF